MDSDDDGSDKEQRFHAAFERGRQGDVDSFDIWLKDWGYMPERVDQDAIAEYFRNHPDIAPNHQDSLEAIGEYIGFATNRGEVHHVVLIGPTGIGKTQLLHSILFYVSKIDDGIEPRLFEASTFGEKVDDRFALDNRIDEIDSLDKAVLAIDDCHLDKRIDHSLKELHNVIDVGILITAWTPEGYSFYQEEVVDAVQPSTELHLGPFSKSDAFAIIDSIIDFIAEGAPEFDREAKEQIHNLSHAVPSIVVILIIHSLHESFVREREPGSMESIKASGTQLLLDDAMDQVYDLSAQKMEILRWILLSSNPRGRSPGELVDKLNRDKSTISYHLRTLKDQGFVTSQSEGRRSYYKIPSQLASLVQLRLEQDQQLHAEL